MAKMHENASRIHSFKKSHLLGAKQAVGTEDTIVNKIQENLFPSEFTLPGNYAMDKVNKGDQMDIKSEIMGTQTEQELGSHFIDSELLVKSHWCIWNDGSNLTYCSSSNI
jgi:hypothetical protein